MSVTFREGKNYPLRLNSESKERKIKFYRKYKRYFYFLKIFKYI